MLNYNYFFIFQIYYIVSSFSESTKQGNEYRFLLETNDETYFNIQKAMLITKIIIENQEIILQIFLEESLLDNKSIDDRIIMTIILNNIFKSLKRKIFSINDGINENEIIEKIIKKHESTITNNEKIQERSKEIKSYFRYMSKNQRIDSSIIEDKLKDLASKIKMHRDSYIKNLRFYVYQCLSGFIDFLFKYQIINKFEIRNPVKDRQQLKKLYVELSNFQSQNLDQSNCSKNTIYYLIDSTYCSLIETHSENTTKHNYYIDLSAFFKHSFMDSSENYRNDELNFTPKIFLPYLDNKLEEEIEIENYLKIKYSLNVVEYDKMKKDFSSNNILVTNTADQYINTIISMHTKYVKMMNDLIFIFLDKTENIFEDDMKIMIYKNL